MMRSSPSSSSSVSSSSYSLAATSLTNRLETIFKKASELCTLCDNEVCVIHYGPDGELKTWPEDRDKVRDMALRFSRLDEAKRRKKSVLLYEFLKKKKKTITKTSFKKKAKYETSNKLKYPISVNYSADQISQLTQSLELNLFKFQERLRFVEAQEQKKVNLDHQIHQKTQSFHPSAPLTQQLANYTEDFSASLQESGLEKNHLTEQELKGCDQSMINSNNFQLPCVSNTQAYSALPAVQESVGNYGLNQLMQQELYGCYQNMTNSNNFQHPCVSNTQAYLALPAVQESVNNNWLNQFLMQQELYGYGQNMCASDITNSNVQDPCLSNTVLDQFCSVFQNPYGCMVGNTSFSQDFPDMSSSCYGVQFDENSLLQTSTLPSLSTIPNSYLLSNNSLTV